MTCKYCGYDAEIVNKRVDDAFKRGAKLAKEKILEMIKGIRTETRCPDCGVDVPCDDCNSILETIDIIKERINQLGEK